VIVWNGREGEKTERPERENDIFSAAGLLLCCTRIVATPTTSPNQNSVVSV